MINYFCCLISYLDEHLILWSQSTMKYIKTGVQQLLMKPQHLILYVCNNTSHEHIAFHLSS